jgi:hypothetical protein
VVCFFVSPVFVFANLSRLRVPILRIPNFDAPYSYCILFFFSVLAGDFSKGGMNASNPVNAIWAPKIVNMFQPSQCNFIFELVLDEAASITYGAPQTVYLNYTLSSQVHDVDIQLTWFNKTATRLAEAMWLSFSPLVGNPQNWVLDVMDYPVSPFDVAAYGSRHLHAIWDGVRYVDPMEGTSYQVWFACCSFSLYRAYHLWFVMCFFDDI